MVESFDFSQDRLRDTHRVCSPITPLLQHSITPASRHWTSIFNCDSPVIIQPAFLDQETFLAQQSTLSAALRSGSSRHHRRQRAQSLCSEYFQESAKHGL